MLVFKEDILQYIYQFKHFKSVQLKTIGGEEIQILKVGEKNLNSGPDFLNAQIKIGNILLSGNVEIHINSSDWYKHNHQTDKAYNNVILHVVYNNDKPVSINNVELPTLVLKGIIDESLLEQYENLLKSKNKIACAKSIGSVPEIIKNSWIDRMLIERMEDKSSMVSQILANTSNSWEETFYQVLAYTFGFGVNKHVFLKTAQVLPLQVLAKHKNNLFQLEALLFGTAGLLNDYYNDEYAKKLQNEYGFLKSKYSLNTFIEKHEWRFSKMHPSNFATIRIAQFAMLIYKSSHLFSKILEAENTTQIKTMFDVKTSEYWETHYMFDKPSDKKVKSIGNSTIDLIIINAIIPTLFIYSRNNSNLRKIAIDYLLSIKSENNAIVRTWKEAGIDSNTAYTSQSLLHLKTNYCDVKKCLQCAIGNYLVKR